MSQEMGTLSCFMYCRVYLFTFTGLNYNMWHDQEEWVTCQQYSILIFQYISLVHLKCYILIQFPSQSDIWLQRYEHFFEFKNNVKHTNLSLLLACNLKSIFPTSDSFPLIMSHIFKHLYIKNDSINKLYVKTNCPFVLSLWLKKSKLGGETFQCIQRCSSPFHSG